MTIDFTKTSDVKLADLYLNAQEEALKVAVKKELNRRNIGCKERKLKSLLTIQSHNVPSTLSKLKSIQAKPIDANARALKKRSRNEFK